jgi:hypothetical protein
MIFAFHACSVSRPLCVGFCNKHMKCAKVRMNRSCHWWQFWRFFTVTKVCPCKWTWTKCNLEMKVKVKSRTWIILHVLKRSFMQKWALWSLHTLSYRKFKSKIRIVTLVWPWNIGLRSNMGTFLDSLGMTFYTLAILLLALKPIVNKLFSLEIVIFHTCTLLFYFKNMLIN